jgi:hypothetical protein
MNKYTSGDFNKYGNVYSLKANLTPDASGHVNEADPDNWNLVGPRHFKIMPRGSKEFMVGSQLNSNVTHLLATTYDRQSKALSTKDKFVYQGRTFSLYGPGINVDEKNRFIEFPAIESPMAAG